VFLLHFSSQSKQAPMQDVIKKERATDFMDVGDYFADNNPLKAISFHISTKLRTCILRKILLTRQLCGNANLSENAGLWEYWTSRQLLKIAL